MECSGVGKIEIAEIHPAKNGRSFHRGVFRIDDVSAAKALQLLLPTDSMSGHQADKEISRGDAARVCAEIVLKRMPNNPKQPKTTKSIPKSASRWQFELFDVKSSRCASSRKRLERILSSPLMLEWHCRHVAVTFLHRWFTIWSHWQFSGVEEARCHLSLKVAMIENQKNRYAAQSLC